MFLSCGFLGALDLKNSEFEVIVLGVWTSNLLINKSGEVASFGSKHSLSVLLYLCFVLQPARLIVRITVDCVFHCTIFYNLKLIELGHHALRNDFVILLLYWWLFRSTKHCS